MGMGFELELILPTVLISQVTAGFGAHKTLQSCSRFPVPAVAFCLAVQGGFLPRECCGLHMARQSCWEARAFCAPSPTVTANQSAQYFLLQKSRSLLLIHKNAASPASMSKATFFSVIWHPGLAVGWSHTRKEGCKRSSSAAPVREKS